MTDRIVEELQQAVQTKTALIICGSGVSKASDPSAPDWRGLIRSGIEESASWGFADSKWRERRLRDLQEGDVDEWVSVADQFTDKLGGANSGYFSDWLKRTVGTLKICNSSLIDAIVSLEAVIATTNYDDLL
jgi:hypothetical protein